MDIQEEIKIELLNQDSVSITFTKYIEYAGQKLQVGDVVRTAYVNSIKGREDLEKEIKDPYLSSILTIWGDTPTVVIPSAEDEMKEKGVMLNE